MLLQFWTCATTLTSCCRQKIKSYCSYSATVYNSLQTRGHVTQRRITAYYCARMSGYRHSSQTLKLETRRWQSLIGREISCLGLHISLIRTEEWHWAVVKMNGEEEDQNTIHHHHILALEAGTLTTEDRGEVTNKYLFCNNKCSTVVT